MVHCMAGRQQAHVPAGVAHGPARVRHVMAAGCSVQMGAGKHGRGRRQWRLDGVSPHQGGHRGRGKGVGFRCGERREDVMAAGHSGERVLARMGGGRMVTRS